MVRVNGLSTPIFLLAGSAYFVDLFLRWVGEHGGHFGGWDLPLVSTSGWLVIGLLLSESVRARGLWRTPTSSLLGFFLAAATAIFSIAGLVHLRWNGGFFGVKFSAFAYGAWIGLTLALALAAGAVVRLRELERGEV